MNKKKLVLFSVAALLFMTLVFLFVNYRSVEGVYRSFNAQILLNDYKGYEYFKDGKHYSVNLSDQLEDDVFLSGTYKKVGMSTYLIDCPTIKTKYKVKVGYTGIFLDPNFARNYGFGLEEKCSRVYSPEIIDRIEHLVQKMEKEEK